MNNKNKFFHEDFFKEEPSVEHEQKILQMAGERLAEIRQSEAFRQPDIREIEKSHSARDWLKSFWIPALGLSAAAVIGFVISKRPEQKVAEGMSLEDFAESSGDVDNLMDDSVDFDLLAELEEFQYLDDSGILDKELENERS